MTGLNCRPSPCKRVALPAELIPQNSLDRRLVRLPATSALSQYGSNCVLSALGPTCALFFYAEAGELVRVARFELATLWSQTRCATRLRYTRIILDAMRWNCTNFYWFMRPARYYTSRPQNSLSLTPWDECCLALRHSIKAVYLDQTWC